MSLHVRVWSEAEFAAAREAWDGLLAASNADPFFMSWDWQWRWWVHHAGPLNGTLAVLAVYLESGELVGLAPLYRRSISVRRILRGTRLELIGIAWRDKRAMYSDYLDLIVSRAHRSAVLAALAEWLARAEWDDLVLSCVKPDSAASELARVHSGRFAYVREVDQMTAWTIPLAGSLADYVARLGSGARRKMFNQRAKLANLAFEEAGAGCVAEHLDTLRRFTAERWGDRAGSAELDAFQREFAEAMARAGRLRLTRLVASERTLSVMYNVCAGGTEYYLQSGFDAARAQGTSPGYLHFGYAIERAFAEGTARFDLLAGPGRHRDYKRDLLAEPTPVSTHHVMRGALRRWLYSAHGLVTSRVSR